MQCPICSRRAQNLTPETLEGVVVGCADCGEYRISGSAFHQFLALRAEERVAALQAARLASRHGRPMIGTAGAARR